MPADPELIKQITVKEFDSFMDRAVCTSIEEHELLLTCTYSMLVQQQLQVIIGPEPYGPRGLLEATGVKWRDQRHSLTPAFSAAKMKMVPQIIIYAVNSSAVYPIIHLDGTACEKKR